MKKTARYFTVAFTMMVFTALPSCRNPTQPPDGMFGVWTKEVGPGGLSRSEAATFVIGDTAYIGTGYSGTSQLNDFWAYDPVLNRWWQKANFPGKARSSAVAFAIGTKGYVGTGYDGINLRNDFWRWDQASNKWDSVAAFPGTARRDAIGFAIGGYGYVATGFDGTYQNDFWRFDTCAGPLGAWVQKQNFGGEKRSAAVAFTYGTKGYIVTGVDSGRQCGDFWYYNSALDQWVKLRDIYNVDTLETYDNNYNNIERDNGVGFVIGDSAFIATGENSGKLQQSAWGYNFAYDQWVPQNPFLGPARQGAVGFALNGYGFVCTGQNGGTYYNDLYQFVQW